MNLGLEWLLSRPTLETSSDPLKVDMERYELEQTELDFCPPFYPNLAARMSLLGAPVILALLVLCVGIVSTPGSYRIAAGVVAVFLLWPISLYWSTHWFYPAFTENVVVPVPLLLACSAAPVQGQWFQSVGIPILLGASLLASAWLVLRRCWRKALLAVAFGPISIIVLQLPVHLAAWLGFCVAVFLCARLAESIRRHAALFLAADGLVENRVRRTCSWIWRPLPFFQSCSRRPTSRSAVSEFRQYWTPELDEARRYRLGRLSLPIALLAALVMVHLEPLPLGGLSAIGVFIAVLLLQAAVSIASYVRNSDVPLRAYTTRILRFVLVDVFLDYEPRYGAYGVFRSPECSWARYVRAASPAFALTLTALPLASYFPLVLAKTGATPWHAASVRALEEEENRPSLAAAHAGLSDTTRSYAATLPERQRDIYLATAARADYEQARQRAFVEHGMPIADRPDHWVRLSVSALLDDMLLHGFALLVSAVVCLCAPLGLLILIVTAVAGRAILHHVETMGFGHSRYIPETARWPLHVRRLQTSKNPTERRQLWVGVANDGGYPLLLDRDELLHHAHILGGTGSGKTSRALAPMADQLIDGKASVIIIDLKGDSSLREAARAAAARSDMPFRWFSSQTGYSTFAFNPLRQPHLLRLSKLERSEMYAKALGLDYGEGYGQSHFSREHRDVLLRLLEMFDAPSFDWLDYHIDSLKSAAETKLFHSRQQREHSGDLLSTIRALGRIHALNLSPKGPPPRKDAKGNPLGDGFSQQEREEMLKHEINLEEVFRKPGAYYFHLPAALHSGSDREIGKLLLHGLMAAAAVAKPDRQRCYVMVDEFQVMASGDLDRLFEQARSMGIGLILANQTSAQISRLGESVLATIQSCTHFHQVFSANDPEQQQLLINLSGEQVYAEPSVQMTADNRVLPPRFTGKRGARFGINDVLAMSANKGSCFVQFKNNSSYAMFGGLPVMAYADHHIEEEEYVARRDTPWPAPGSVAGAYLPPGDRVAKPKQKQIPSLSKQRGKPTNDVGSRIDNLRTDLEDL